MTATRIIVSGATTALTRRTNLRKAFVAPWDPLVSQCWLYSLAYAQQETGVAVHCSTLVLNHHHTDVTPSSDNLPDFTRLLHREMSCALHALLCERRYDAPRQVWDDRQAHHLRLLDAAAQASRLVYDHINCPAAGLVERPEHMPGAWFDFGLWKTGFIEVERPPVYFGERSELCAGPDRLRLELTPPPLLYRAFGGDMDKLVHHMNRLTEDARARRTTPRDRQ
ncbi:MAG TPA: hypothetical protein VFV94_07260 [Polyangiaceae bacterium]|nr:hypothetical protein [Polyangiaceae bacterium]